MRFSGSIWYSVNKDHVIISVVYGLRLNLMVRHQTRNVKLYILLWITCRVWIIIIIIFCYLIWRNLQPYSYQRRRTYYYPSTPVNINTFSTPQRTIQPGYRLQATGDRCTIAFSVYCQVLIYGWVNRSTFRVQILPRDFRYWRLSVRKDSDPRSRGWESNALTARQQSSLVNKTVCLVLNLGR